MRLISISIVLFILLLSGFLLRFSNKNFEIPSSNLVHNKVDIRKELDQLAGLEARYVNLWIEMNRAEGAGEIVTVDDHLAHFERMDALIVEADSILAIIEKRGCTQKQLDEAKKARNKLVNMITSSEAETRKVLRSIRASRPHSK